MSKSETIIIKRDEPVSIKRTVRSHLAGLTEEQRSVLNETGFWICGNSKCINPKHPEKPRTKLAQVNAVEHATILKGNDQPISVEFKSLHNKCTICGHENSIGIEEITETEEITKTILSTIDK